MLSGKKTMSNNYILCDSILCDILEKAKLGTDQWLSEVRGQGRV